MGLSRVQVKVGSAGTWRTATDTTGWSISDITLAGGTNTVYARATDTAGNTKEDSITITVDPEATIKPEIGNWDYSYYSSEIRAQQNKPEITWDVIIKSSALQYHRPGVTTVYYDAVNPQSNFKMADVNYVKSRFDKATAEKDLGWDYGAFLLQEEVLTPCTRMEWGSWMGADLGTWNIEGEVTLAGVKIQALKPWYIATYGAWDETWWRNVRDSNNCNDPKVRAWNNKYAYDVYKAWHLHMHNLGKKSAVVGAVGIRETDTIAYFNTHYAGGSGDYMLNNYDLIFEYHYPTKIGCSQWDCTDNSLKAVKDLREHMPADKKIGYLLTAEWENPVGRPWSEALARDEFNKIAPYTDIIFARGHYNFYDAPQVGYYPPYLIDFWQDYQG